MTDTTFASPRLERPREAPLRGVCAALARSTGTDPALWRVLAVVLTVFGGLGIALYLVGIATIPREGEQQALADRLLHGPDRSLHGAEWLLLVLLVCSVLALGADVDGLVALAVLTGLGLLWWRGRLALPTPAPVDPDALPGSGALRVTDDWPAVAPSPAVAVPLVAAPRRARSPLTGATASLAAVVAGALLLLGAQGDVSVPAEVVLAAALGVVGLGLAVGAWWGRSWALMALAAVLGLALAATAGTRPTLDAGVGDRLWQPTAAASYRLGAGNATLDLRRLPVREGTTLAVDAELDVGRLLVLVPDGVRVAVDARAGVGEVVVLGEVVDGDGAARQAVVDLGPPGRPQVRLALEVGAGQVEVRRG